MEWIYTVQMATLWLRAAAPSTSARCLLLKGSHQLKNSNSSSMLKLQHCKDWVDQSFPCSSNFWPSATRGNCSNNTSISSTYIHNSHWQLSKETKLSFNSRLNSILDHHHRLSLNMAHPLLKVVVWASRSSNDLQNRSQSTILMSLPRQASQSPINTSLNSNATLVISSEESRRTIPIKSSNIVILWATMLVVKIFTCNIRTTFKPVKLHRATTKATRRAQDNSSIRLNKLYQGICHQHLASSSSKRWMPTTVMSNNIWAYVFKRDKAHSKINSQCNKLSAPLKATRQADQSNWDWLLK